MKTQPNFLAAGIFLAALGTGFGQSTLQFSASTYTVAENASIATLSVRRLNDTGTVVSVDYATADGTATNGVNYFSTSGTLAFAAGETNQTIAVPILDDGLVQGTKTFRVILSNPTGGAVLGVGTRTNATVSITDNDVGIQFEFATYSVAEDAGTVMIAIVRGDDGTNAVSVDYFTSNLTGTSGVDYTGITNTLGFAPQERLRFVPISILNNTLKQANRTLRVTLSNPAGATLGAQKTTTVTIRDNDQGFQFETNSYSISEDAGAAQIRVLRGTDDTNSTVTVAVATGDLTATNGLDYTGTTNTLSFAPGEKVKPVAIPILNDGVKEQNKNFRLTLSNPTGGAVLGSPATATVTIVDNDPGIGFELSNYSVWENSGALAVNVLRGNDAALDPITVDFATSNLTAAAATGYQATNGTLAFGQNETIKTITIPILRNTLVRNDTSFRITLRNPTGGAVLGTASTTITIQNATEPGTFRTVAPPFDTALNIQRDGDISVITWNGGGQLQRADYPTGPWQTLATPRNFYTVQSPAPATFYRVTLPRPVNVYIPSNYNGQTNVPLVILLHGYHTTGQWVEDYMRLRPFAEARGFLYCYPDSTSDAWGWQFWNATDSCCDFGNTGVDDAGFLRALIEEISDKFVVDRKRIHLVGHSNGAWMCYRMACQSADLVAGIACLAGMTSLNPSNCAPSQPVNVLHIHGTGDTIIAYAGGALTTANPLGVIPANMPAYPGALQTVQIWAAYDGATGPVTDSAPSLDIDLDVAGLDTTITRYTNAPPGGAVELWTINGSSHSPTFYANGLSSDFAPRVIDWLLAHPKP